VNLGRMVGNNMGGRPGHQSTKSLCQPQSGTESEEVGVSWGSGKCQVIEWGEGGADCGYNGKSDRGR